MGQHSITRPPAHTHWHLEACFFSFKSAMKPENPEETQVDEKSVFNLFCFEPGQSSLNRCVIRTNVSCEAQNEQKKKRRKESRKTQSALWLAGQAWSRVSSCWRRYTCNPAASRRGQISHLAWKETRRLSDERLFASKQQLYSAVFLFIALWLLPFFFFKSHQKRSTFNEQDGASERQK